MPKFSTVQAYSDNNSNVQTVSFQQAIGGDGKAETGKSFCQRCVFQPQLVVLSCAHPSWGFCVLWSTAAKTEKIVNAYGSTAGANSGEFHVYRQARAREMARMETLRLEQEERLKEDEFQMEVVQNERRELERTNKRRKKRQRHKEAKRRRQTLQKAGIIGLGGGDEVVEQPTGLGDKVGDDGVGGEEEDEFAVLPDETKEKETVTAETSEPLQHFANDGSFMAMMQQKLAEEARAGHAKNKTILDG